MTTPAQTERRALADLLVEVGPDAPTLCEGWTARDLAAHIVVRDRRPDSAPGVLVPALGAWTERVRTHARDATDYRALVEQVRGGPPRWSPVRVPAVDDLVNTVEFLVHHEDVRRAQPEWTRRELGRDVEDRLWVRLRMARALMRRSPVGIVLEREDGRRITAKSSERRVTVSGPPSELVMFAYGRQGHAVVGLAGDPADVQVVREASFGI